MSVSREAYQDLVKENEGLKEQLNSEHAEAEHYRLEASSAFLREEELQEQLADAQAASSASALECQTKLLDQERVIDALAKKAAQFEADREYNAGLVRTMEERPIGSSPLISRIWDAWAVLTGRAEAVIFEAEARQ